MIPQKMYIPHIPACVYLVCFLQPKYTAVGSFSWHYFPSSSLLCIILFSVSTLIWTLTECFSVQFKYFCKFSMIIVAIWLFLQQFFNTCYLFWKNSANVCDTQYLHSNRWWHHTIWWWLKHIPCIFIQGNYHLGKLSKLAKKDHCFRP